MSLVLVYSDPHLREFGSFPPFNRAADNGLTRELNNIVDGFKWVESQILKYKPTHVVLAGDVFHTPEGVPTTVLSAAAEALGGVHRACEQVEARHYIMPGNHDCASETQKIFLTSVLTGFGNVLEEDVIVNNIGFVQFRTDKAEAIEALKFMCKKKPKLIITHLDFEGATYESGHGSKSQIPCEWPVPIISGDIHLPQTLGDNNVHYVGSLVQNRFNRQDLHKVGGAILYDLKTKKHTRLKNTGSKHYVKVLDLSKTKELDPERCVLQIRVPEITDQDIKKYKLDRFEYVHVPESVAKTVERDEAATFVKSEFDSPIRMLKTFVEQDRPDAADLVESVIGAVLREA